MRRFLSIGLLVLFVVGLPTVYALNTRRFSTANAPVSVSSTKTVTLFTDNQSNGGTGTQFQARWVLIRSCGSASGGGCTGASANTCYYHLGDDTAAKTKDVPVEPGASILEVFPKDKGTGDTYGWNSITTICDTAETAIFRIDAGE